MSTEIITERQLFSDRLKILRGTRRKAEFSRELGIPAPVYQRYEDGRIPSSENLSVIAARCGVTVDWLLGRADAPLPSAASAPKQDTPGSCRYPTDCDLPAQIRELRADYQAMKKTLATMAAQMETVTGLLGHALGEQLGANAHGENQKKAG